MVAILLLFATDVCLLMGFLTPMVGTLAAIGNLGIVLTHFPAPASNYFYAGAAAFSMIIMPIGIALLGPGAFSLDAYLFGRREIVIPPASRTPEP